tara:strand:+ start:1288 stop:1791 length:504 start_codon:yes stop_codon:yes gene_type:complete
MSRLDSFIRRVLAQRDCLSAAATMIDNLPGPILELGLGNGRTYDHLRECLPDREIFVFDRQVAAHPKCIPDEKHMIIGDIRRTLPGILAKIGAPAVLTHCDIGTGDKNASLELAEWLGGALKPLLAPGAIVVSDQKILVPGWIPLPLPSGVPNDRYFMARVEITKVA